MSNAVETHEDVLARRLNDGNLFSTNCAILVRRLLTLSDGHATPNCDRLSDVVEDLVLGEPFACSVIAKLGGDPEASQALKDLDIDQRDHQLLHEIFDPDGGGTISIVELLDGLKRLRGFPL